MIHLSGIKHIGAKAPEPMGDVVPGACQCGARWRGANFCHCARCHLTFRSVNGFDMHRWHGRCRTAGELRKRGFEPDAEGIWRRPMTAAEITRRREANGHAE